MLFLIIAFSKLCLGWIELLDNGWIGNWFKIGATCTGKTHCLPHPFEQHFICAEHSESDLHLSIHKPPTSFGHSPRVDENCCLWEEETETFVFFEDLKGKLFVNNK